MFPFSIWNVKQRCFWTWLSAAYVWRRSSEAQCTWACTDLAAGAVMRPDCCVIWGSDRRLLTAPFIMQPCNTLPCSRTSTGWIFIKAMQRHWKQCIRHRRQAEAWTLLIAFSEQWNNVNIQQGFFEMFVYSLVGHTLTIRCSLLVKCPLDWNNCLPHSAGIHSSHSTVLDMDHRIARWMVKAKRAGAQQNVPKMRLARRQADWFYPPPAHLQTHPTAHIFPRSALLSSVNCLKTGDKGEKQTPLSLLNPQVCRRDLSCGKDLRWEENLLNSVLVSVCCTH